MATPPMEIAGTIERVLESPDAQNDDAVAMGLRGEGAVPVPILDVGMVMAYAGPIASINRAWKECNGQAISRTAYPRLFDLIGVTFGNGDGSSTFNLPNLQGMTVLGVGTGGGDTYTLGETAGDGTHSHQATHNHPQETTGTPGGSPALLEVPSSSTSEFFVASDVHNHTFNTDPITAQTDAGSSVPPYVALFYVIKCE